MNKLLRISKINSGPIFLGAPVLGWYQSYYSWHSTYGVQRWSIDGVSCAHCPSLRGSAWPVTPARRFNATIVSIASQPRLFIFCYKTLRPIHYIKDGDIPFEIRWPRLKKNISKMIWFYSNKLTNYWSSWPSILQAGLFDV